MGKSISLILVLQFFIFISDLSGQKWLPLEVGNNWQYLVSSHNDFPEHQYYYLSNDIIESDSVINNNTYFNFIFYNSLLRYDSLQQKILIWCDTSDFLLMDFNLPTDTTLQLYNPECYYDDVTIISSNETFNDSGIYCKGFYWFFPGIEELNLSYYFAKGFGILKQIELGRVNGGFSWQTYSKLIQANLSGINYSENYNPEIIINPITSVRDSIFNLTFSVQHEYNRVYADTNYYSILNFIDTVKMYSYYTDGVNIIENPIIYALNQSGSVDWVIDTTVNLNLLMNSYKFNYRIEAIDKGIIPHRGFAPDSGYFEAIFDTATTINSFNNPNIIFRIYQNYPNPFNPTTTINYQIPQTGFVSLKIYDILGKEIATLVNEEKSTGSYEVKFDGSRLPSGVYFCRIKVGNFIRTKKMMLLK